MMWPRLGSRSPRNDDEGAHINTNKYTRRGPLSDHSSPKHKNQRATKQQRNLPPPAPPAPPPPRIIEDNLLAPRTARVALGRANNNILASLGSRACDSRVHESYKICTPKLQSHTHRHTNTRRRRSVSECVRLGQFYLSHPICAGSLSLPKTENHLFSTARGYVPRSRSRAGSGLTQSSSSSSVCPRIRLRTRVARVCECVLVCAPTNRAEAAAARSQRTSTII